MTRINIFRKDFNKINTIFIINLLFFITTSHFGSYLEASSFHVDISSNGPIIYEVSIVSGTKVYSVDISSTELSNVEGVLELLETFEAGMEENNVDMVLQCFSTGYARYEALPGILGIDFKYASTIQIDIEEILMDIEENQCIANIKRSKTY